MKSLLLFFIGCFIIGALLLSGCELVTHSTVDRTPPDGPDLVINEVYTLSPDKYYAFTWIELFNATRKPIPWFSVNLPGEGVAVGTGGTAVYTDFDGREWDSFHPGSASEELRALTFPYTDTGLVAGYDGTKGIVFKIYKDGSGGFGGRQNVTSPAPGGVNDISFPLQSRAGYCVCDGGKVYRSLNFGLSWAAQNVTTTKNINAIALYDFTHIWVCGDSGTIFKRVSASSWVPQAVPSSYVTTNFYSVFFTSDTSGWVVGDNGAVLHTRNSGANWRPETSSVSVTLRSGFSGYTSTTAAYFKEGRAWACGDNGVIVRTDNDGADWYQQNSQTTARLNKIIFVDSLKGWAFGDNGTIVATTDGGRRWQVQGSSVTTENLLGGNFIFPPTSAVLNYYEITMLAQKRHYFVDPVTGFPNTEFIVSVDTGLVHFIIAGENNVPVQGFTIINNDSAKFKDHFKLGPGQTNIINYTFGFDTVVFSGAPFFIEPRNPLLWNLLSSGEIRLEKKRGRFSVATGAVVSLEAEVLDIVRYGNYRPAPDPYPANEPLGFLPDGWSIARFADDVGGTPADQQSTIRTFYMTRDPIPGWFSQESRP